MRKTILGFCLLLSALYGAEGEIAFIKKPAVLFMPDEVVCKTGTASYELSGEISFRWNESTPLFVDLWKSKGWAAEPSDKADYIMGEAEFFDEEGTKIQQWSFISIPPPSSGTAIVHPGESRRFPFFVWNARAQFPKPGKYCAIATFMVRWKIDTMVVFTTSKRWFTVVEAPPDPKKEKL